VFIYIEYSSKNRNFLFSIVRHKLKFYIHFWEKKNVLTTQSCHYKADGKKRKPLKIPPSKISLFARKALYIHGIKKSLFRGKNPVTPIEEEDTCLDVVSRPVPAFRIRLALLPAPLHQ
jgi:hypothetical protein